MSVIYSTNESNASSSPLSNRKKADDSRHHQKENSKDKTTKEGLSKFSDALAKKNLQYIENTFGHFLDHMSGPKELKVWEEKLKIMQVQNYINYLNNTI